MVRGLEIFTIVSFSIVIIGMPVACLFLAAANWNIKHLHDYDLPEPRWVRFACWLGRIKVRG